MLVKQDKEFIITHGSKECLQIGFEILADYYFLSGVPILSMHAPFELASKLDVYNTYKAFKAFYK